MLDIKTNQYCFMKKIIFALTLLIYSSLHSQNVISHEEKIDTFIHIWGLLKYNHPEISQGEFDYNKEFILEYDKLKLISDRSTFNEELSQWMTKFDSKNTKYKSKDKLLGNENLFHENEDFDWIENSEFNTTVVKKLYKIKDNLVEKGYYASVSPLSRIVSFENEIPLTAFDVSIESHRLLFLSSFWNAMAYWNVNLYLTDKLWSEVLTEMISEFLKTDNFGLAKDKLFSRLGDSHSNYSFSEGFNSLIKFPNFKGRVINDSLVVTNIYHKERQLKDNISKGDVIFSVEGLSLKEYYTRKFSDMVSVSNSNYLKRLMDKSYLLASDSELDSVLVSVRNKNGKTYDTYIKLYELVNKNAIFVRSLPDQQPNWKKLGENIGYLNLFRIDKDGLKEAFNELYDTEGIIIDLRNYPRNINASEITKYLYPKRSTFIKVLASAGPSLGEYEIKSPLRMIMNPFMAGQKNANYYKGKVVLLVDRSTASNAEFIGMAIQNAPNCITIGEQTCGAVLNRNQIMLIDSTSIDYTSRGAFYPNDKPVQRKGLKIDYEVKESAVNYNPNLYTEEAVRVINGTMLAKKS